MLISIAWLKDLVASDAPPESIARALTSRGLTVDAVSSTGSDTVLDIDVPANRPDALGHLGIAREIAAAFGVPLLTPPAPPAGSGAPVMEAVTIAVDAPDLCGRYTARLVRDVTIGPSPAWLRERLESCGLRSINNVVDVSNYVMLETGHPNHTFDLALVRGAVIHVRRAEPGEVLVTLDGGERRLTEDMCVIADVEGAVGLGGVMGGANSEIREATRDVLIEAAWFLPASIRRTARRLGLSTDASQRFERGADPEGVLRAQDLCVRLLVQCCGGAAAPGVVDIYPQPFVPRRLSVRLGRVASLLGWAPPADETRAALSALGLAPRESLPGVFEVQVPSWRVDLEREADLIEEIGRHLGYDRIPTAPVPLAAAGQGVPADAPEERTRDRFAHLGFHEAINYAMLGPGEDDPFILDDSPAPITLSNPISDSLGRLRRSVLSGLARSAAANLRRGVEDVRLFETGRVFIARAPGEFPSEPARAGFAWAGAASPRHWSAPAREVDLWDVAGIVEDVLTTFRPDACFDRAADHRRGFQEGAALAWSAPSGERIAWCGRLSPVLADALESPAAIFLGEIDLDALGRVSQAPVRYRPLPRVPGASRDLSLVLPATIGAHALLQALGAVASPAPARFTIADRYAGPPLAPGESSVTVRVILQPLERTLTDDETEGYRQALVAVAEALPGVRLRSGA